MKKEKYNKNIKCDVESCKHNNSDEKCCELESISVSTTNNNEECESSKETVCESFDKTSSNINDNEYEVESTTEEDYTEEESE